MKRVVPWLTLLGALAATSGAQADDKKADKPADKKAEKGPRRDPAGIKGISPFWEAINKGDSALIARDFQGAIAAYREAITKEPQNALGHYRIGEADIAKGDLKEADEAFQAGLRFVGTASALKAKLEFAIADLRERQKAFDDASQSWTTYEKHTTDDKSAKGFPATATERKKVIEAWKKISAESAEVKARIEKRLKEADESVRKSSK
ncbi:MAG TPA: tetratricopeptide repeat protein [Polyangiaceae bacterium]|jgi:tetratricopeptide (TPR) repeat protein